MDGGGLFLFMADEKADRKIVCGGSNCGPHMDLPRSLHKGNVQTRDAKTIYVRVYFP